jgi:hypothetical protein
VAEAEDGGNGGGQGADRACADGQVTEALATPLSGIHIITSY